MKKSISLFCLALLPLSLVACNPNNNSSTSQELNYIVIDNWLDADLETMSKIHPDITIPFYKGVFETIGTEVVSSNTSTEEVVTSEYVPIYTYESNYAISYISYLNKVVLTYTTSDVKVVDGYIDLITSDSYKYTLDESLTNESNHDYYAYLTLQENSSMQQRYYLNVYFENDSLMYIFAYLKTTYFSATWPQEAIDSYMLSSLTTEEDLTTIFPKPSNSVYEVSYVLGLMLGNSTIELKVSSHDDQELAQYKQALIDRGYSVDPYYETDTQVNYYLIASDKSCCFEVNIDKVASNNTFAMRLMITY